VKPGFLPIFSLIVATSVCDTISQLFLKSSIDSFAFDSRSIKRVIGSVIALIRIPRVWPSFLASTLSLFIWLFVLSKADLNFAFSLDSMHYIFIALGSMWFLKEKVSPVRWLGIVAIAGGIFLVSLS